MSKSKQTNTLLSVLEVRNLTETTYILKLEKGDLEFQAGQYIALGIAGTGEMREYSIYSGESDDFIEVLVKEVDDGLVSKHLRSLGIGSKVEVDGPFGFFTINHDALSEQEILLIASGTGIAPFHSYVKSYPGLKYKLLHGVRTGDEIYEPEHYHQDNYVLCTSRDDQGKFHGRVTEYLAKNTPAKDTIIYLCGNSDMIHDAYDILTEAGVSAGNVHAEVYF